LSNTSRSAFALAAAAFFAAAWLMVGTPGIWFGSGSNWFWLVSLLFISAGLAFDLG
jgi:hypothetical protein